MGGGWKKASGTQEEACRKDDAQWGGSWTGDAWSSKAISREPCILLGWMQSSGQPRPLLNSRQDEYLWEAELGKRSVTSSFGPGLRSQGLALKLEKNCLERSLQAGSKVQDADGRALMQTQGWIQSPQQTREHYPRAILPFLPWPGKARPLVDSSLKEMEEAGLV